MRSSCDSSPARPRKCNPAEATLSAEPGHSSPTTFFLRSERDMHRNSRRETADTRQRESSPKAERLEDGSFGVQSLEDILRGAFSEHTSQPRQPTVATSRTVEGRPLSSSRRRNPVHPKIAATAQRIISSDYSPSRPSSVCSSNQRHSSTSPLRDHLRNISNASRDFSFASLSPKAGPCVSSTPCSGSVRSLGLSDEEGSMLDDCGSQAVHSESEDEDEDIVADEASNKISTNQSGGEVADNGPQLVMPSLSMPKRRPFTSRGKNMGRLRVLVMGASRVGKTSLIRSIMQTCDDIVHVDPSAAASILSSQNWLSDATYDQQTYLQTNEITEVNASTKAYPPWWSDMDETGGLKRRRSTGGAVLDRNICFVDTPGWSNSGSGHEHMEVIVDDIVAYIEDSLRRNASLGQLEDSEVLNILSGGGGTQIDAILYVFGSARIHVTPAEIDVLRRLSSLTNLIPIIGRADTYSGDHVKDVKAALRATLESAGIRLFTFNSSNPHSTHADEKIPRMPYAVSSAVGDDSDVMDASLLMSPEYKRPLLPSELPELLQQLFEPDNIQWLRHCAVKKLLRWRREHPGTSLQAHKDEINALSLGRPSSMFGDAASEVHSLDMEWSMISRSAPVGSSGSEISNYMDMSGTHSPLHIAAWAQDLQRALGIERSRLLNHCDTRQITLDKAQGNKALSKRRNRGTGLKQIRQQCFDGSLGGTLNTQDPLGVLALGEQVRKRGWMVLQVVGGCSVAATVAVWMVRNWGIVAETFGFRAEVHDQIPGYALLGIRDEWRNCFWGDRW